MTPDELERLMFYWPKVLRTAMAGDDDWLQGFARSIACNAKRLNWTPTAKQAALMVRLVSEITMAETDGEVVE